MCLISLGGASSVFGASVSTRKREVVWGLTGKGKEGPIRFSGGCTPGKPGASMESGLKLKEWEGRASAP
jgi:hypothetical protein